MSDLQISLLVIGGFMIAGVYLFNWWQERRFRRRTEHAFSRGYPDVLLRDAPMPAAASDGQIEPKIPVQADAAAARPSVGTHVAAMIDPVIDYVVEVDIRSAAVGADVHEELLTLAADWDKPVQVAGYDPDSGEWHETGIGSSRQYSRLHFALQMANRAGCVSHDQLAAFHDVVTKWAARNQGEARCMDVAEAHAAAVQLDGFCANVDITVGINVMARAGDSFSGATIRTLADSAGLILGPYGVFCARSDQGDIRFTLENHDAIPFVPEQMKTLVTGGVTFLLDVPRVEAALRAFDAMLETARSFTTALGGVLVDDKRCALSDGAIAKIRHQLEGILARMDARQIAAGSTRALRLFS
jgi:FtsZ-interacting cell division protein ZipA